MIDILFKDKTYFSETNLKFLTIFISLIIICFSAFSTVNQYKLAIKYLGTEPFPPGQQYSFLKPYLKNVENVGYITDRNLSTRGGDPAFLLSAQFELAPTRLDVGNESHYVTIYDYKNGKIELIKKK